MSMIDMMQMVSPLRLKHPPLLQRNTDLLLSGSSSLFLGGQNIPRRMLQSLMLLLLKNNTSFLTWRTNRSLWNLGRDIFWRCSVQSKSLNSCWSPRLSQEEPLRSQMAMGLSLCEKMFSMAMNLIVDNLVLFLNCLSLQRPKILTMRLWGLEQRCWWQFLRILMRKLHSLLEMVFSRYLPSWVSQKNAPDFPVENFSLIAVRFPIANFPIRTSGPTDSWKLLFLIPSSSLNFSNTRGPQSSNLQYLSSTLQTLLLKTKLCFSLKWLSFSSISELSSCRDLMLCLIPTIRLSTRFQFSWPKYTARFFFGAGSSASEASIISLVICLLTISSFTSNYFFLLATLFCWYSWSFSSRQTLWRMVTFSRQSFSSLIILPLVSLSGKSTLALIRYLLDQGRRSKYSAVSSRSSGVYDRSNTTGSCALLRKLWSVFWLRSKKGDTSALPFSQSQAIFDVVRSCLHRSPNFFLNKSSLCAFLISSSSLVDFLNLSTVFLFFLSSLALFCLKPTLSTVFSRGKLLRNSNQPKIRFCSEKNTWQSSKVMVSSWSRSNREKICWTYSLLGVTTSPVIAFHIRAISEKSWCRSLSSMQLLLPVMSFQPKLALSKSVPLKSTSRYSQQLSTVIFPLPSSSRMSKSLLMKKSSEPKSPSEALNSSKLSWLEEQMASKSFLILCVSSGLKRSCLGCGASWVLLRVFLERICSNFLSIRSGCLVILRGSSYQYIIDRQQFNSLLPYS